MNLDSGGGSGEEEEEEGEEEEDSHSEEFQTGNACGREQRQCRVAEVGESSYEGEREGENATVRRKLRSRERATQKTGREIQGANDEAQRKKKKKKRKWIGINLTNCKYESVRRATRVLGLREVGDDEDWTVYWTDYSVSMERVIEMKRYQRINHFPGMSEICRKDLLARNMNRMLKLFRKDYNIFPQTWCLPADYVEFQAYQRSRKNKTFICKPDSGCQGKGIFITRKPQDIRPGEHLICQQYISKPFIVDGFKLDLRLYVLVTSCDPLRVFLYQEGLVRFATSRYSQPNSSNLNDVCMHLTNYAINKHNANFIQDEETGSKRKLSTFKMWLEESGYDVEKLWGELEDVVIKTLISAHPTLKHNYHTGFPNQLGPSACFEILGFDILLDFKLKPWLLEVNHSPSFTTDSQLDQDVKEALLIDTLTLLNLGASDRQRILEEDRRMVKERLLQRQRPARESRRELFLSTQASWLAQAEKHEEEHCGGFHKIFPREDSKKYAEFFKQSCTLFQETVSSKAREECARKQLEELRLKQELEGPGRGGGRAKHRGLQGESAGERALLCHHTTI
ncbi:tubulin polyglutamylase ttll6-like, partial [Acipenser ruthenus]|uniref:tubulin polyglutamylase ttll6-like n=1 Tax=Acipenser ruthenus TaxID=7906 RepID=UPI00145AA1BD